MSLKALVGAVAPNLDVAIEVTTQSGAQFVARPDDWLEISGFDLIHRLNPTAGRPEADTSKAGRMLMQPIQGIDGQMFGRAFISPARYSYPADAGWVTVSGLRAARLHNVEGVLVGEAMTAARDAAKPTASMEALSRWASKQAELIADSVKDEERQAKPAEVVLECGGNIGALKFIKLGTDWLAMREFEEHLRSSTEFAVSFDGEFYYDEDQDDVHPKEFREHFEASSGIALVLKHDSGILKVGNTSWPRSITGKPKLSDSNVAAHVRDVVRRIWGGDVQEDEEERVVCQVGYTDITRRVMVVRAAEDDPI